MPAEKLHARDAEDLPEPLCFHLQRSRRGRGTGSRLGERRGHRGVEPHVPLDLLQHLVDVSVQDADRPEPLEEPERLFAVVGTPSPVGVNRPQRDVREDDDRCAARKPPHVVLEPGELLRPQTAEAARLEIEHVDQPDEMRPTVVEAVPPRALGAFAVAVEVALAIVGQNVVLARDVKHPLGLDPPNDLVRRIELARLRELADVACVKDERRPVGQGVDPFDRRLERRGDVGVRFLAEADVAVADLGEEELALEGARAQLPKGAQAHRR